MIDLFVRTTTGKSTRSHCILFGFHEMLRHPIDDSVFRAITCSERGVFKVVTRILKENYYQLALAAKVGEQRRTILGMPTNLEVIKDMYERFNYFIECMQRARSTSLGDLLAQAVPGIADIYKFHLRDDRADKSRSEPELVTTLDRLITADLGRCFGSTPSSADVSLTSYLGYTGYDPRSLLDVLTWARDQSSALGQGVLEFIDGIIAFTTAETAPQRDAPAVTPTRPDTEPGSAAGVELALREAELQKAATEAAALALQAEQARLEVERKAAESARSTALALQAEKARIDGERNQLVGQARAHARTITNPQNKRAFAHRFVADRLVPLLEARWRQQAIAESKLYRDIRAARITHFVNKILR